MAEPVFNQTDRVDQPIVLPPELQNKSPMEIAAHYQARERAIIAAGNQPPNITRETYDNDPMAATQRMIDANSVSRSEWNQVTSVVQANLIETAKQTASQGKPYWGRLFSEIERAVKACDPISQIDPSLWTTAYNEALGRNLSTIQAEEQAAAVARASASAEPPSGGSTPPAIPRILSEKESRVCEGLNLTHDQFRRGEVNLSINKFPVTLDNRRS